MKLYVLLAALLLMICFSAQSQPVLQNDYSYSLQIPSVTSMESSAAHLYVLSESEGMAVFRTHKDSLQWLYTASGMQQRGKTIRADIRFAYLFGNSKRLTVLEPTSVMGAYSATTLPDQPLDAIRFDENLYVALGPAGLGELNLKSPQTLDSPVKIIDAKPLENKQIIALAASADKLFALAADRQLFIFNKNDRGISFDKSISLDKTLSQIFYVHNTILGTDNSGNIFEITSGTNLSKLGSIGEAVTEIKAWNDWLIIKGNSNRLWTSHQFTQPTLWKRNGDASNYIATSKGQFWICEYNRISKIEEVSAPAVTQKNQTSPTETKSSLQIQPIKNQVIPYPHALLIPLTLEGDFPVQNVQFSLQTDVKNARLRGQSLYWKPASADRGEHQFKVVASTSGRQSSSTSFTVDVQPFNTPPRFTPMRTISIPVNRPFNLPVRAIDPDGTNKNLIRYLGVNLPRGASLDEQTGKFSWKPDDRQLGENSFRIIATDQYGAASSTDVNIRVIETNSGDN